MRNLRIVNYHDTLYPDNALSLSATAWDTSTDSVICAFGPNPTQPVIKLRRQIIQDDGSSEWQDITSWDAPCPLPDLECDEILLLQYFADNKTSCLVLAGGDVVVVREEPSSEQEKIEIVGSVDAGIVAAAWAPDEELLAIVTRADALVLMSRGFEPVGETAMTADDLNASKHVSVGWGKKETQFQGKRAKVMRDPTMPEHVDEGKASPYDDGRTGVSWRGDGEFVAINSIVQNHRRVIRVYSRAGVLDSASEPVDGLESALSWRPAGNLIASIKQSTDKVEVVFFERNGLRHGEFDLRLSPEEIRTWATSISLSWNADSTALAVIFQDRVQIWTMGNYHYFLKQELRSGNKSSDGNTVKAKHLRWHPEKQLKTVYATSQSLIQVSLSSKVTKGSVVPPFDYGTVAVVDGKALRLTPFRNAGVPPPMAFCEIQFDHNIVDVAINRTGTKVAVLTAHTLEFCTWDLVDTPTSKSVTNGASRRHGKNIARQSLSLPQQYKSSQLHKTTQVAVGYDNEVYILAPSQKSEKAMCLSTAWKDQAGSEPFRNAIAPAQGLSFVDDVGFSFVSIATERGIILALNADTPVPMTLLSDKDSREATQFQIPEERAFLPEFDSDSYNRCASLDRRGTLYIDETPLARSCTSFAVTDAHLVFTTNSHLLKFVHLTYTEKLQVPGDTPEVDERCRSVERGAKIVTVIPSSYAVVLQMPRGNLETIYPRILVVTGIRKHLDNLDYRPAFQACQNHQVDMNILHDHNPKAFIDNIPKFVEQLRKASRIDAFLSKLKEEDVTETLYRDTSLHKVEPAGDGLTNGQTAHISQSTKPTSTSKVNRICDALLSYLTPLGASYLQNVITAHVCKRPPDLKSALTLVSSLREKSQDEADLAVSHLCFLSDSNRLYDTALSLYDLELTLLVAQNAQRDPREYMPFLQSLQALSEHRRRYQIDNHLRKYDKALASLHTLEAHDEAETYFVRHELYTQAMELYKYDNTQLPKITRLYADHLTTKSQHAAAANLYESLGDFESAYPLYALAHQWRESLTCASLVPLDTERLQNHALSLATTCSDESRDYRSAATIYIEYLDDIPTAAKMLCKGCYFAEAMRVLSLHPTQSLNNSHAPSSSIDPEPKTPKSTSSSSTITTIQTLLDPLLSEKTGEILELLASFKTQITSQLPRIHDLRKKKAEDPLAFYGGEADISNHLPDNLDTLSLAPTDTSTMGGQSMFTRYGHGAGPSSEITKFGGTILSNVSRKTSKTKRREERKRARGKKGSVYEEEYLVNSLRRLIERVNDVHDEVKRLCDALVRRGWRDRAEVVTNGMKEVQELCEDARLQVWGGGMISGGGGGDDAGHDLRPSGADGVFWDSQRATSMVGQGSAANTVNGVDGPDGVGDGEAAVPGAPAFGPQVKKWNWNGAVLFPDTT